MGSILLSSFTYNADVPSELAEIARRAMSRQPEDRFASVEAMRLRLEWYLRHRGSLAISAEASRRLEDMTALVATGAPAESLQEQLYHLFAECRFGFRQALKESIDNETARLGLRRAIETIVRFELDRGAPDAAAGALAELEAPPAELVEGVASALRARKAEKRKMAQLERLDAQLDPTVGRRTRLAATSLLGVLWTIFPQLAGWAEARWPVHPYWSMYAVTSMILFLALFVVLWGRESLSKTAVNRRMVAAGMIAFATQLALEVGGHLLGLAPAMIVTLHLLLWAMVMACFSAMVDRRFWAASGFFYLSFLVAAAMPARRWDMMSASTFVMLISFAIAWWRPSEDLPRLQALRARLAREEAERRARGEPPTSLR
jgi:serine/threonine-protein kinase